MHLLIAYFLSNISQKIVTIVSCVLKLQQGKLLTLF